MDSRCVSIPKFLCFFLALGFRVYGSFEHVENEREREREKTRNGRKEVGTRALVLWAAVSVAAVDANYFATNYVGAPANYYDYECDEGMRARA